MAYDTVEAAVKTLVQTLEGFEPKDKNVSQGDYRVMAGGVPKAVILQPGPFRRNMVDTNRARSEWAVSLELYVAFREELSQIASDIRAVRQAIIDMLDKYPTLNSTAGVVFAMVSEGSEPDIWEIGSRKFWRQVMTVRVEERQSVTYAE